MPIFNYLILWVAVFGSVNPTVTVTFRLLETLATDLPTIDAVVQFLLVKVPADCQIQGQTIINPKRFPEGYILGPPLFIMFVNDMPLNDSASVDMHATIYKVYGG